MAGMPFVNLGGQKTEKNELWVGEREDDREG